MFGVFVGRIMFDNEDLSTLMSENMSKQKLYFT